MPADAPVFQQSGQNVGTQTNVQTLYGGIAIGTQTSIPEMTKAIAALRADIAVLPGLAPDVKTQLDQALDTAAGVKPSPDQAPVKAKLDGAGAALETAAATLDKADGVAEKALKLAKTVFKIGTWVVTAAL